jgi:hypothetical protein
MQAGMTSQEESALTGAVREVGVPGSILGLAGGFIPLAKPCGLLLQMSDAGLAGCLTFGGIMIGCWCGDACLFHQIGGELWVLALYLAGSGEVPVSACPWISHFTLVTLSSEESLTVVEIAEAKSPLDLLGILLRFLGFREAVVDQLVERIDNLGVFFGHRDFP